MTDIYTLGYLAEQFNNAVDRLLVKDIAVEDAFYKGITPEEDGRLLRTAMKEISPNVFDQKRPGPEDQIARADIYAAVLTRTGHEEVMKDIAYGTVGIMGGAAAAAEFEPKAPAFAKLLKASMT
jgi:hypothetical protein